MRVWRMVAAFMALAALTGFLGVQPFGSTKASAAPTVTHLGLVVGGTTNGIAVLQVTSAAAVGDVIAVAVSFPEVAGAITVTDDGGNTWTSEDDSSLVGLTRTAIFSTTVDTALSVGDSITVDTPAPSDPVMVTAIAMTGVIQPAVDSSAATSVGLANHGLLTMDLPDVTTTVNDAVIFAAYGIGGFNSGNVFTEPGSFTEHVDFGQGSDRIATAYRVVGTANSYSADATYDSDDGIGNLFGAFVAVAFQSAVAPVVTDLGASAGGTAQGDTGLTILSGVPVGDVIAVAVTFPAVIGEVSATDDAGNTYFIDADLANDSLVRTVILSAEVTTALAAGDNIQVFTPHTGGLIHVAALAMSGVERPPVDSSGGATDGADGHTQIVMNPGNVTTTVPGAVLFAAYGITGANSGQDFDAPGNFVEHWDFGTGGDWLGTAYNVVGTAATYSGAAVFDSDDGPGAQSSAQAMVAYQSAPVDDDPPVTEAVVDITEPIDYAGPSEGPDGDNGWYVSFTNIQLQPTDASGIQETRCLVLTDGAGTVPTTYAELTNFPCGFAAPGSAGFSGGIRDVYFASADPEGNIEDIKHVQLKIDTTDPATAVFLTPSSTGENGWLTGPVLVEVTAADDSAASSESGLDEVRCVILAVTATAPATFSDIPAGCDYSTPGAEFSTDGEWRVYTAAKDLAGNESSVVSTPFKLDATDPVPAITLAPPAPNWLNGFYNTLVSVTVSSSDATSGGTEIRCAVDGPFDSIPVPATFDDLPSEACSLTSPFFFGVNGEYIIYAASKDNAGNESAVISAAFKIDTTPAEFAFYYDYDTGDFEVQGLDANGISSIVESGGTIRTWTITDNAGNVTVVRARVLNLGFFAYFRLIDVTYADGEPEELSASGWVFALSNFPWTASYAMVSQRISIEEPEGPRIVRALWFSQGGPGTTTVFGPGGGTFPGQVEVFIVSTRSEGIRIAID